jgi:hypothetical protein
MPASGIRKRNSVLAVSEDYPYPRAIWFADEHTVMVIDVALRQYTFRV